MFKTGPASEKAIESIVELGFSFTDVDFELPRIPTDLTVLGSAELMSLMVQYNEFANFASTQLAFAVVDERYALQRADEKHHDIVSALSSSDTAARPSRSTGITMHKAQASAHPEYQHLKREAEHADAYVTVLKSVYENLDRSLKLLSREVTRRSNSMEQRVNRWSA